MPVWRNSWGLNDAIDLNQFARIGAIFFGEVQLILSSEEYATIREKTGVLGLDSANSPRFSCRQRNLPEICWRVIAFRYKQGRTVRRQPHDLWIGNCRRDDRDGTAGYRDLCNLETSSRAFIEVNAHTVGYCLAGERLQLPIIGQLCYRFHNGIGGRTGPPEDESSSDCNDDYSGCNPYPSSRPNGHCMNPAGRRAVSIRGTVYSGCPVRNRLRDLYGSHCRLVDDGGHEPIPPLRQRLDVAWCVGIIV